MDIDLDFEESMMTNDIDIPEQTCGEKIGCSLCGCLARLFMRLFYYEPLL